MNTNVSIDQFLFNELEHKQTGQWKHLDTYKNNSVQSKEIQEFNRSSIATYCDSEWHGCYQTTDPTVKNKHGEHEIHSKHLCSLVSRQKPVIYKKR